MLQAKDKLIVAPKKTIPICKGRVPALIEKNVFFGFKTKANNIPKNTDSAALPINKTINRPAIKIMEEYCSILKTRCLSSINRYQLTCYKSRCI